MTKPKPENNLDGVKEAEDALAAAQAMPPGPGRIKALKEVGRLRYKASERRLIREARKLDDELRDMPDALKGGRRTP